MHFIQYCLAITGLLGLAAADVCRLPGRPADPDTFAEDAKLCVPQGEGHWTFALYISAIEMPTDAEVSSSHIGFDGASSYRIYDNSCRLRFSYATNAEDCNIPFVVEENFLQQVLTIESQNTMIGGGDFRFTYGNGAFGIGEDGCTCQDMSDGLRGAEGCKCAFSISGVV